VIQAIASDDVTRAAIGVAAAVDAHLVAAAPELRRLTRSTVDPALRRAALRALGQLGDRAAVPLLREVAIEEAALAADQSGAAAAALAQLGEDGEVRAMAARRLASQGELDRWTALVVMTQLSVPEAAPQLIAILGAEGGARPERVMAAEALGAVAARAGAAGGEPAQQALSALTDCLGAPDASLRAACAEAIAGAAAAGARSRPAYDRVVRLLGDRDDAARAAAALAAARLDPARFAGSMGALARERREIVLAALARGLAGVPGPRAVARLARLAESQVPSVRLAAAHALAGRAEPRAARALAGLALHRDPAVRAVAMRGLRQAEALRAAMRGDAPEVGAAALAALIALEGRWESLPDAAELIAEQPAASVEQAVVARAWLVR
jgi:HEAT repeat protein